MSDKAGGSAAFLQGGENVTNFEASPTNCQHYVYVCDLNTPWDVHLVTARSYEVTSLSWDTDSSSAFVVTDSSGHIEIWQMRESLISEWRCIGKADHSGEVFLKSMFITGGRKTCINMDKLDCDEYHDMFVFRPGSEIGQQFGQREMFGIVLISHTGLAVCLGVQNQAAGSRSANNSSASSTVISVAKSLDLTRNRIKNVDISFIKDGSLLVATSNGDPQCPIHFYSLKPSLEECIRGSGLELEITIDTYPGLFTKAIENGSNRSEEDKCLSIVDLLFVNGDDNDSFLVATQHPAGGRLELWELKEFQHNIHKMFFTSPDVGQVSPSSTFSLPAWHYVEQFSGPASQIVAISTPKNCFQTGRAAACYVTVGYSDGSIQCLIRDNLQQIGSVDLPKTGNLSEEPSVKMSRASVTICDMSFTSTGNALVTIDSLGQLYIYRMSPITDPGGPHVPLGLQTMLQYCLVSGYDWWDVTICVKQCHIDTVCNRLEEDFGKQTKSNQDYYFSRHMAMKSSLFRLFSPSPDDYKAADCYALLMLTSIYGTFKSLLGPSEMTLTATTAVEKVSSISIIYTNLLSL
jgi:mediator of RNA polymerase II transcription subunit 16